MYRTGIYDIPAGKYYLLQLVMNAGLLKECCFYALNRLNNLFIQRYIMKHAFIMGPFIVEHAGVGQMYNYEIFSKQSLSFHFTAQAVLSDSWGLFSPPILLQNVF